MEQFFNFVPKQDSGLKMDRRQKRTRQAIFSAFTNLLSEKNYNKISIQEIIDKADIGRTTFYAHFETKDDLLQELCNDLFNHVFSTNPHIETTHDFSLGRGNLKEIVTHILYHLRDSRDNIIHLFQGESKEIFIAYFRIYLNEMIVKYILKNFQQTTTKIPEDFLKNHISGAFVNMIEWWINRNLKETPEQLCDYFLTVIKEFIK